VPLLGDSNAAGVGGDLPKETLGGRLANGLGVVEQVPFGHRPPESP